MKTITHGATRPRRKRSAFTLLEVLVTIAVIGIVAAIGTRMVTKVRGAAMTAEKQRTAQDIVNIYASAQAAGYDFRYDTGKSDGEEQTVLEIINRIIDGVQITDKGTMEGTSFGMPGLDNNKRDESVAGASEYLAWDDNVAMLVYKEK